MVRPCWMVHSVGHMWNTQLSQGTTTTPFLLPFWSGPLAHLTKLYPHQHYPSPRLPLNLPFTTKAFTCFLLGWLFSPPYSWSLEYSGRPSSSKVEKCRSSIPCMFSFLNSENHPKGHILKRKPEDTFWSLTGLNPGCVTFGKLFHFSELISSSVKWGY